MPSFEELPMAGGNNTMIRKMFFTSVVVGACAVATAWAQSRPDPIVFETFDEALAQGAQMDRVVIVYFTADWCGVCHRMHATTFGDADVRNLATGYVWAKVDIDAEPHIAAAYGITGVPAVVLLNARGEILQLRPGFISPEAMEAILREHVDQSQAPGLLKRKRTAVRQTVLRLAEAQPGAETAAAVSEALLLLAGSDASGRRPAQQALLQLGRRAIPGLVAALRHERLAVRAAAFDLLQLSTDTRIDFDPFADVDSRNQAADLWDQWLQSQPLQSAIDY